jgi:micrococcal nuclease
MAKKYYLIAFLAFIATTLLVIKYFYPKLYTEEYQIVSEITPTSTPQITPTPITGEEAFVKKVIDGDTIIIDDDRKVRYIGIDSPEEDQCYFAQATKKNIELVEGKKVFLVKDIRETDDYGRLLRYVYVDDVFVNLELVKGGYAKLMLIPPDTSLKLELSEAQDEAYHNNLGLWSACSL